MTRIAVVDKSKCNPIKCGNYLCRSVCPINRTGDEECIVIDDNDKKIQVVEELCIDKCTICTKKCPFKALSIVNLPSELDKDPIHRYSENGFALYNLPVPIFGKVVGIIGRNGIGKSTALKILAGLIKPNLGNFKEEIQNKQIIDYFKGTEAQAFFEKLFADEIKVSYKPQQVDLIPKAFDGTVLELLEKSDERNELDKIVDILELRKVLDRDIKNVSGGELQRIAIAATVLKKANVYFFDEPTSYLDIKQRLKISKFIRSLANKDTAVMVIEHDLIILDYMTDLTSLMFGKEAIYGICSHVKSTKLGINTYLSGYSKDENMRFRSKAITFVKPKTTDALVGSLVTAWPKFERKLGNFELKSESGEVNDNQVIGILGENGIGKTSFVKTLAGVDSDIVDVKVKLAYKAQYLETSDDLVINILQDAIAKYTNQLIKPLDLEKLFERQLNELSGGELQRVAIAHCLSQEADLFLLDEPSAYLDVEQRILISKIIKEMVTTYNKSAIVVDHDLLFIDYLSDKLIVFEGEPAISGVAKTPSVLVDGMNSFLTDLKITFRRDEENNRPRANKIDSQLDRQQKSDGKLYYG
jgi:ATP-binding cassette, sub-family E, member 1